MAKNTDFTAVVRKLISSRTADDIVTEYDDDGQPIGPEYKPRRKAVTQSTRKSTTSNFNKENTMTRKNTAKPAAKPAAKKAPAKKAAARTYNNDKTLKVVAGNLGKDPQHVITQSGKLFVYFPLAVNGEDGAIWYQINAWEGLGMKALKWLRKGRFIKVQGRYSEETFKGEDGKKHTVKKIVASSIRFLDDKVPEEA